MNNLAYNIHNTDPTQELHIVDKPEIEWIDTKTAAEIMNVELSTVSKLCRNGKLHCRQHGAGHRSIWEVDKASAEAYEKTSGGRGNKIDFSNKQSD